MKNKKLKLYSMKISSNHVSVALQSVSYWPSYGWT